MSLKLKPLAVLLGVAGLIGISTTFAADDSKALQLQLASMQRQINVLQAKLDQSNAMQTSAPITQKVRSKKMQRLAMNNKQAKQQTGYSSTNDVSPTSTPGPTSAHPLHARDLVRMMREENEYLPFDLDVPGQAFVSTGPYVGVPIQYSGSNLIVNSPSVNTDVQLLSIRKSIHKQLMAMGGEIFKEPYHSHLLLSGVVEGQASYANIGGSPSTTNIDVTNVALDAFFLGPSEWILGFIEFNYDGSSPINNSVFLSGSNYTDSNSRVFVNKAFATLGNFSESPFYGSFGQFYVPFGTYSSVMISTPFTKILTRTKARSALVGFQQQGECNTFYGAAYIFRGDSHAASVSKINNGGMNIGYKYKYGVINGDFGGGLIANIADSGGMQIGNGFSSFEQISHRVPGLNVRGVFGIGDNIDFIGEFVGATTAFSASDMAYNGKGAKPWALDFEAAYTFSILNDRPSTIALGYQKSNQALSLGLPSIRYAAVMTTSLLRNTLQSLEFHHDRNYAASSTGNGPIGAATTPGACTSSSCTATGKGDNVILASFDYYF